VGARNIGHSNRRVFDNRITVGFASHFQNKWTSATAASLTFAK
jgi:hypothetical protein